MIIYHSSGFTVYVPEDSLLVSDTETGRWISKNGIFERDMIEWSKQFADQRMTFVDVGSHMGTYSLALSPLSRNVISFEPRLDIFYQFCGNISIQGKKNIVAHRLALSDVAGTLPLYHNSQDGGTSSIILGSGSHEIVEVRTLDSFGLTDVSFIKIDAEGAEPNILLGAKDTIALTKPKIIFESNDSTHFSRCQVILSSMGYKTSPINGVSNMFISEYSK